MVTKKRATKKGTEEEPEENLEVMGVREGQPAVKPEGLTDEQAKDIEAQADQAVKELLAAKGSEVFSVGDKIAYVGIKDQRAASSSMSLLQEKMGNVFYSENKINTTERLTKDISNLQGTLAKINPKDIQKEARYRIIKLIPFFGGWVVRILRTASDRRLTLQQFVDHLEESLRSGETMLKQDNAQLKVMYLSIEEKQKLVASDAYFAEVLIEKLSEAVASTTDERKRGSLQKVLFRVATRAQDLRAMENVHEQFFVSIQMTRENNDMLVATVQRMLTLGMQVVYIAFAIHAALMRQKSVLEAEKGTREFLGSMIVNNATLINSHVKEIGDLYKQPIIAMDKLETAIDQLEQSIDATNRLKAEGIEVAKTNITKVKQLTQAVRDKAGSLPETDIKSLEAGETLQLTEGEE